MDEGYKEFKKIIASDNDTIMEYLTKSDDPTRIKHLSNWFNDPTISEESIKNIIDLLSKRGFYNYLYQKLLFDKTELNLYSFIILMIQSAIYNKSLLNEYAHIIIDTNSIIKIMMKNNEISDELTQLYIKLLCGVFTIAKNYSLIKESEILEEICCEPSNSNLGVYCKLVYNIFSYKCLDYKNQALSVIIDKIISLKNKDFKKINNMLIYCKMLHSMVDTNYIYTMYKLTKNNGMIELTDFAEDHTESSDPYYISGVMANALLNEIHLLDRKIFPHRGASVCHFDRLTSSIYYEFNDLFEELICEQTADNMGQYVIVALKLAHTIKNNTKFLNMTKKMIYMGGRILSPDLICSCGAKNIIQYYEDCVKKAEILSIYKKKYIKHFINNDIDYKGEYESEIENIINSYINMSLFI